MDAFECKKKYFVREQSDPSFRNERNLSWTIRFVCVKNEIVN